MSNSTHPSQGRQYASVFDLNGVPRFGQALPLALQHVVAMIVGCVTPAIIVSGVAGLNEHDQVILVQAALFASAISTLLQLFPFIRFGKFQLGSALPVIMGISFAYVPSMQAIAETADVGTILAAQLAGGFIAILVGLSIQKIRILFPPIITGTVVFTIGLSLYPTAINYMAGGTSSPDYGSWKNWLAAFFTLAVVVGLNHFAKGTLKLASILIGIITGYIFASFLGLVDLSGIQSAGYFQLPKPLHFGLNFDPSACIAIGVLFCYQLNTGDRRLLCYYGRKYEPAAKGQGASGRYRNVRCYQHFVFSDRWSSDCHLQPECRDSYYNQSHQPLCSRTCGRNPSYCRIRTKVLRTFDDDSTVRAGRSNDLRLCFHRHDRNQAHHAPGDELPQHRHCRVVRSSWYGNYTGTCCPCYIPCLGNNYLRQISGCCGNSGGNSVEYHSSKGEKRGLIH